MATNIGIIGTGRLGLSLAYALQPFGKVRWVCNRSGTHISGFTSYTLEQLTPKQIQEVDCIALCTTDKEIENVVEKLVRLANAFEKKVVFHCSGALSVSLLEPLQQCGAFILAMHPYQTFPYPDKQLIMSIPWLIEGDKEAMIRIKPFLEIIQATTYKSSRILSTQEKLLWHSTAVISSNFTATLYQIAAEIIQHLKIDAPEEFIRSIAQQTIVNAYSSLQKQGRIEMSGPIVRGDMNIVQEEIDALANVNPLFSTLYQQLSEATLQISTSILNDSQHK